jgi:hypothetical protein
MASSPPEQPPPVQTVNKADIAGRTSRNSRLLSAAGYRQSILTDLVSQYGAGARLGG